MGSLSTAVKWVSTVEAIEKREKTIDEDLVTLWEAIAQGKETPENDEPLLELPESLATLLTQFSQRVAAVLNEMVAKETIATGRTAAEEIAQAEARSEQLETEYLSLMKRLTQKEEAIAVLEQNAAELQNVNRTAKGRIEELEDQRQRDIERYSQLESAHFTQCEELGRATEFVRMLEKQLGDTKIREASLREELAQILTLEREKARLEANVGALEAQCDRERQGRTHAEQRAEQFSEELIQRTREAATATERATQYETRLSQLLSSTR
jgi:chromosome segregation ATPase